LDQLLTLLAAQVEQVVPSATGQTYTLASIITILGGVVAIVARAYVKARDDRDRMANETMERVMTIIQSSTEAHALQKTSNYQVAKALEALDRRIERLEEKVNAIE